MRIRTLFLYLIGNRQAILDLASDRRALWIGFLFVLSAGFAREYDGQDLLREPWHLVVPLGASLVASFLLFLVACGKLFLRREGRPPFFTAYRSFLTLFWLTAPLAFLYAVPYERFLSPGPATSANMWTLGLVATWRVALMVRVVSVLTGQSVRASCVLVLAFADAVALAAVAAMPKPIFSMMGGVRLTESESIIQSTTFLVSCLGVLSAPLWVFGGLAVFVTGNPTWQILAAEGKQVSARSVWLLAVASLAIWISILPWTQSEQQLRSRVESDMEAGHIAEALDVMSAHAPSDFPPHWDPPPRVSFSGSTPDMLDVMDVLTAGDWAPWVRATYIQKFRQHLGDEYAFFWGRGMELTRIVRLLQRIPEGPGIAAEHARPAESRLSSQGLDASEREGLNSLLKLAGKKETPVNH